MEKMVYFFGDGNAEGNITMKKTLGGKGAGLAEMTNIGVPVPPGFTITSQCCLYYEKNNYMRYVDDCLSHNADIEVFKKIRDIFNKGG